MWEQAEDSGYPEPLAGAGVHPAVGGSGYMGVPRAAVFEHLFPTIGCDADLRHIGESQYHPD